MKTNLVRLRYLFVLTLTWLISSCQFPVEIISNKETVDVLPAIDVPWDSTQSIVCFGTSLTYGFEWDRLEPDTFFDKPGALDSLRNRQASFFFYHQADSAYPFCLDKRLKIKVYNQGHPGALVSEALEIVVDSVLSQKPALVLLEFSANDFLQGRDAETTEQQMSALTDTILTFGSKVILLSFVDEETLDYPPRNQPLLDDLDLARDYFNMLQRLARQYNLLLLKDCFYGIFGVEELMSDDIHPNYAGYKIMAQNILQALYDTFLKNYMLK